MKQEKIECKENLEQVIEMAKEMIKALNGKVIIDPDYPDELEENPMAYFIECYEDLSQNLTRAIALVVKSQLTI